ncbi:unnamed protein product, partial [Adineta steineri]
IICMNLDVSEKHSPVLRDEDGDDHLLERGVDEINYVDEMNVVIPNLSPYNIVSKDEEGSSDGVNTGEGNKHDSVRGKKKRKFEVVEYEENCEKDLLEGKENNLHHQHNYDFKKCKKRCARLDERINQLEMELMQTFLRMLGLLNEFNF